MNDLPLVLAGIADARARCVARLIDLLTGRPGLHVPFVVEESEPCGVVNARDALRALLAEEEYEESLLRDDVMGVGYR